MRPRHHERGGGGILDIPSLAQDRHGNHRADEGSGGKEPCLTRRAEQPEGAHVEHQTHPITDESQKQCRQRNRDRWPRLAGESARPSIPRPAPRVFMRVTTSGSRSERR